MKKLIFILLLFSLVFSQQESFSRSLTIYKDNFAVIKEPIIWNLKSGSNTTSFSNISKNLLFDSPALNIEGVQVLSQTLNKNFSSTDSFLKNSIGSPVEIIPTSGSLSLIHI